MTQAIPDVSMWNIKKPQETFHLFFTSLDRLKKGLVCLFAFKKKLLTCKPNHQKNYQELLTLSRLLIFLDGHHKLQASPVDSLTMRYFPWRRRTNFTEFGLLSSLCSVIMPLVMLFMAMAFFGQALCWFTCLVREKDLRYDCTDELPNVF